MRLLLPIFTATTLLFASTAGAQEVICDPENPGCNPTPSIEPADAAGSETICDPENPACAPSGDLTPPSVTETICDPENPNCAVDPATPQVEGTVPVFQNVQFLGAWGTRLDVDSSFDPHPEDIVEVSSYFDLALEWDASDSFRVVVEGNFRHWVGAKENPDEVDVLINATDARASFDARLGEAYALWIWDAWSIAVGNLVTRWGSTDLSRPGDVVNPVDQTSISTMSAPERIPQLTVDLTYSGANWSVQGLLVPFFEPNRVWAFGRDSSLLTSRNPVVQDEFPIDVLLGGVVDDSIVDDVQPLILGTSVPDEVPNNASLGLRATATFLNTDVGLGYWHGWDRTPFTVIDDDLRTLFATVLDDGQVLQDFDLLGFFVRNPELRQVTDSIAETAAAGDPLFASDFRRLDMLLVDFARYVGPIGVRADVAGFARKTYLTESLRAVRRPTVSSALGLSWERLESEDDVLTITLEGFWDRPFASDSSITEAFVDEDLRGSADDPLLIVGDGTHGVAGAILWSIPWIDTRLQIGGVFNASHGDGIGGVSLSRRFLDAFTASVGYTLFAGPDPEERLTLGGIYDDNDHLSFGISGIF